MEPFHHEMEFQANGTILKNISLFHMSGLSWEQYKIWTRNSVISASTFSVMLRTFWNVSGHERCCSWIQNFPLKHHKFHTTGLLQRQEEQIKDQQLTHKRVTPNLNYWDIKNPKYDRDLKENKGSCKSLSMS